MTQYTEWEALKIVFQVADHPEGKVLPDISYNDAYVFAISFSQARRQIGYVVHNG